MKNRAMGERERLEFVFNNTKIRIVGFLDPAALIVLREYYKHLVMVILLDNGSSEVGANAATASIADCENVDGVLHGFENRKARASLKE
jgi:hypothetical protein